MPPETFDEFWNDIVELAGREPEIPALKGFTKSYIGEAKPEGLMVASKKGGKPALVPRTLFMVLWNALTHSGKLDRKALEEDHNLSRVAFLMAFVSKLDYVKYEEWSESINLEK